MAKNITVDNFEKEVLQAAGPVLVDFWANLVRTLPDAGTCSGKAGRGRL